MLVDYAYRPAQRRPSNYLGSCESSAFGKDTGYPLSAETLLVATFLCKSHPYSMPLRSLFGFHTSKSSKDITENYRCILFPSR